MSDEVADRLRTAREACGLSTADVAARLKVPVAYVEALDGGNLSVLPEATFVRGYARAYAKLVGVDAAEVSALLAPVEVKAPRQQVGISGMAAKDPRRAGGRTSTRMPRLRRHHFVAAAVLLVVAGGWVTWTGREPAPEAVVAPVAPLAVPLAPPVPALSQGLSQEVPLPGATAPLVAAPGDTTTATPGATPLALPGAAAPSAALPAGGVPATATTAATVAPAAPATPAVPAVPRNGLLVRFSGDCWVEVRDADNKVIHQSFAKSGNEVRISGKEPLTVTLGRAERAELWWNGDQVAVDSFSRGGVARVNVGRISR